MSYLNNELYHPPARTVFEDGSSMTSSYIPELMKIVARCTAEDMLEVYVPCHRERYRYADIVAGNTLLTENVEKVIAFLKDPANDYFAILKNWSWTNQPRRVDKDMRALFRYAGVDSKDEYTPEHYSALLDVLERQLLDGLQPPAYLIPLLAHMKIFAQAKVCRDDPGLYQPFNFDHDEDLSRLGDYGLPLDAAQAIALFLEQSGFHCFEVMADLAEEPDCPPFLRNDFLALLRLTGVSSFSDLKDSHFKCIADTMRSYLVNRESPVPGLVAVLNRIHTWAITIMRRTEPSGPAKLDCSIITEDGTTWVLGRPALSKEIKLLAERISDLFFIRKTENSIKVQEDMKRREDERFRSQTPTKLHGISDTIRIRFEKELKSISTTSKGDFEGYYTAQDSYRMIVPAERDGGLTPIEVRNLLKTFEIRVANHFGLWSHMDTAKYEDAFYVMKNANELFQRAAGLFPADTFTVRNGVLANVIDGLSPDTKIKLSAFDGTGVIRADDVDLFFLCSGHTLEEHEVEAGLLQCNLAILNPSELIDADRMPSLGFSAISGRKSYCRGWGGQYRCYWYCLAMRKLYSEDELRMMGCLECIEYLESVYDELYAIYMDAWGDKIEKDTSNAYGRRYRTEDPIADAYASLTENSQDKREIDLRPLRITSDIERHSHVGR